MWKIPRWTDNPNFNAQAAHFAVGFSVAMVACAGHHNSGHAPRLYWPLIASFQIYALLKEFWYDANYELPAQTMGDNFEDWLFYELGLIAGVTVGGLLNR